MSSNQPKKKPPATLNNAVWKSSDARHLIAQDIIDGRIPPLGTPINPTEIFYRLYGDDHPYFKNFPFDHERYKTRIESLRETVDSLGYWAKFDDQALLHDLALRGPPATHNIRGQLRWDGSAAQGLLKADVANKAHVGVRPKVLWQSRPEYQLFDLTVFRKHIDQCKQAEKEWGQTPGQSKHNKRKVGGEEYKRTEDEEEA